MALELKPGMRVRITAPERYEDRDRCDWHDHMDYLDGELRVLLATDNGEGTWWRYRAAAGESCFRLHRTLLTPLGMYGEESQAGCVCESMLNCLCAVATRVDARREAMRQQKWGPAAEPATVTPEELPF